MLNDLFLRYCSIGHNTNSNMMTKTKFIHFLKDCKLVKGNPS